MFDIASLETLESVEIKKQNAIIENQIIELEKQVTPRRAREILLGDQDAIAFVADIENQISVLRTQFK